MTTENTNFDQLGLPIPDSITTLNQETQSDIFNYLSQMDKNSQKAYIIAKDHLGSSFNILKSNGYKEWKMNKKM